MKKPVPGYIQYSNCIFSEGVHGHGRGCHVIVNAFRGAAQAMLRSVLRSIPDSMRTSACGNALVNLIRCHRWSRCSRAGEDFTLQSHGHMRLRYRRTILLDLTDATGLLK